MLNLKIEKICSIKHSKHRECHRCDLGSGYKQRLSDSHAR